MRVTIKGQVTIPQHIREKLGIVPASEVEFVEVLWPGGRAERFGGTTAGGAYLIQEGIGEAREQKRSRRVIEATGGAVSLPGPPAASARRYPYRKMTRYACSFLTFCYFRINRITIRGFP